MPDCLTIEVATEIYFSDGLRGGCQVEREYWSSGFSSYLATIDFVINLGAKIGSCRAESGRYLANLTAPGRVVLTVRRKPIKISRT